MAKEVLVNDGKFTFKSITLLKDQSLGIGSYGAVCKAKCDDLLCAAKIIHPTLFDPSVTNQLSPKVEHRTPIRRFEQECEVLSAIRHPNVIQYLGMFRDTVEPFLPVLLMELMDDNLTNFIENAKQPIPYHTQVNICHDITRALSFLHSNGNIHRDLSSNNVLLIEGGVRAKVTDFGMARFDQINPHATNRTNTMCPGTEVYMPPEAVQDNPVYSDKIDCFSFGVVTLQIVTQLFPKPGERYAIVDDPRYPRPLKMDVPEVDRRQNHIDKVGKDHPLLPLILDCIRDRENERPSASQLCDRIADLKSKKDYKKSAHDTQGQQSTQSNDVQQASQLQQDIDVAKEDEIIVRLQAENDQIRTKLNSANEQLEQQGRVLADMVRKLDLRTKELGHTKHQLQDAQEALAQFEKKVAEQHLLSSVSLKEEREPAAGRRSNTLPIPYPIVENRGPQSPKPKLKWRKGKRVPYEAYRWCDAVVDGHMVYIRNAASVEIYCCDVMKETWYLLPHCIEMNGSIAIVNGLLTTIGGKSMNKLYSLVGEDKKKEWIEKFPPMPTKRGGTAALSLGPMLIVAGGVGEGGVVLSTVELMDSHILQWSSAPSLPQPICYASMCLHGDHVYILGESDKNRTPIKSVYTCSVRPLFRSLSLVALDPLNEDSSADQETCVWSSIADLPVTSSACKSVSDRLLAIGGKDASGNPTKDVYMYVSSTDSWETFCHMRTGRYDCFAAVVPENRLMIIGGSFARSEYTDSVEFIRVSE